MCPLQSKSLLKSKFEMNEKLSKYNKRTTTFKLDSCCHDESQSVESLTNETAYEKSNILTDGEMGKFTLMKLLNENEFRLKTSIFSLIDFFNKKFNIANLYSSHYDSSDGDDDILSETDLRVLRLVWTLVKSDMQKVGIIMFMK
jgi:hypothetical protein